jgi:hypothetical protein
MHLRNKEKIKKVSYQSVSMLIFIIFVYFQVLAYIDNRNNISRFYTLQATNQLLLPDMKGNSQIFANIHFVIGFLASWQAKISDQS